MVKERKETYIYQANNQYIYSPFCIPREREMDELVGNLTFIHWKSVTETG